MSDAVPGPAEPRSGGPAAPAEAPVAPWAGSWRGVVGAAVTLLAGYALAVFQALQYAPPGRVDQVAPALLRRGGIAVEVLTHAATAVPFLFVIWLMAAWRVRNRRWSVALFDAGMAVAPVVLLLPCLFLEDRETRQILASGVLGLTVWRLFPLVLGDVGWSGLVPPRLLALFNVRRLAALAAVAAGAFLWFGALRRHEAHWSSLIDLGLFYELYDNAEGSLLYAPSIGQSFLGEHFSPILVLLTPLVRLIGGPEALLVIQALALALSGWFLFLWAEGRTRAPIVALAVMLAWLLSPFVQNAALYDFHMDMLEPALLFGLLLALDRKRPVLVALAALGLWLTKEDTWIYTGVIALWALSDRTLRDLRMHRLMAMLGALGLVLGLVVLLVILPALRAPHDPSVFSTTGPAQTYAFLGRYSHLGGSLSGILSTLATNPLYVLGHLLSGPRLGNLLVLFIAFGGAAWAARWGLLLLVPALEMLLGNPGLMSSYLFYYGAIAFMFAPLAAVVGASNLLARPPGAPARAFGRVTPGRLATAILAITAGLVSWHPSSLLARASRYPSFEHTPRHAEAARLIERVPAGAKVSATGYLAVHLQPGRDVRMFPYLVDEADWILVDLQRPAWPLSRADVEGRLVRALAQGFSVEVASDGLVLMRRGPARPEGRAELEAMLARPRVEAELSEQTGFISSVHDDDGASNGGFLRASPDAARGPDYLLYGPFARPTPGKTRVTFRLRWAPWGLLSSPGSALAPAPDAVVATIDVVVDRGRTRRAHRDLTVAELGAKAGAWADLTLDATLERGDNDLEMRVFWHGIGRLDVDVVEAAPLP
ncbi:MAG: DUF2079 domain-containing protein [Deltaproteobacteria bacterium]|nr:DUF2079 domain-containing protein [Deltaproteobacteria bacterium]